MSAPVPAADLKTARLITGAEWRQLRLDSLAAAPVVFAQAGQLPDVLLGYQKQLLATTARNAVTVVEKSRRTGVTWAAAADAVLTSASQRSARGMDTFYVGYNLDMAREFIDTCAMWSRAFNEAMTEGGVEDFMFDDGKDNGADKSIQAFRIRFASGFEIVALASRPRSLRGRQGYVIIDEAAFHDDLPGVLQSAMALLIWGGKVLIISTHNGEDNPYNALLKEVRGGKKPYALLRVDFDDALRDGLHQRISLIKGEPWSVDAEARWRGEIIAYYGDTADEELFCIPAQSGGAWLTAPLIEARARADIPVIRLAKPDDFTHWPEHLRTADIADWCARELRPVLGLLDPALSHYLGADIGRISDLSVFWPLAVLRTMIRHTPFVVELRNVPFDSQRQILSYILRRLPRFGAADIDATGIGAAQAEAAAQEFGRNHLEKSDSKSPTGRIAEVKLSVEWYRDNMQPVKTAFEDATITIPRDADVISDFKIIEVKDGVPRVPAIRSGVRKDRHGDACVACVLAYSASRRTVLAYAYDNAGTMREPGEDDDLVRDGRALW